MVEHELFVACAPGLEPMVSAELATAGLPAGRPVAGGVELTGDLTTLYRANLELGLALSVRVRLGQFRAATFAALVDGATALPWALWVDPARGLRIKATASKSRLHHTGAIAERVLAGAGAALGTPVAVAAAGEGAATVLVRIVRDRVTISIDTSGELLHRRGYRQATAKAPLREDLARALIVASGWEPTTPLVDPMCGAGTLVIEAGLLAAGRPPGGARRFAFEDAPGFDAALWSRLRDAALARAPAHPLPPLFGSDRDAGAIEASLANAARAGVEADFARAALSAAPGLAAPGPAGAVVCNPPFGGRIGRGRDLRPLYQAFGNRVRALPPAWRVGLVTADQGLARATGLSLSSALMTDHGGRKIFFFCGTAAE